MQCMKNKPYELLKTGMVGGSIIVFSQYAEAGKSRIRNDQYHGAKTCAGVIIGFDANSLYLYCFSQEMPCGKEQYIETSFANLKELCNQVMKGELFGFFQVDIHVPNELMNKFIKFSPLFVMDTILNELIIQHMKEYHKRTGKR